VFRYHSRIWSFEYCRSSLIVTNSSRNFRLNVRSPPVKTFFTYCWVIVEPPCRSPPRTLFQAARVMPFGEMPGSV
jgi:hypothetical protein